MNSDFETGRVRTSGRPVAPSPLPPISSVPLLRPMEIGELLDEAFDLYRRSFGLFFGIAVLLYVPVVVLALAVPPGSVWSALVSLLNFLVSFLMVGAMTHAAMERLLGRQTTIIAAYGQAARRLFSLIAGLFVNFLAVLGGFILLIIPGIIVMLWSQLLTPVVIVEGRSFAALGRCRELAQGHLWRLLMLVLAVFGASMVIGLVLAGLMGVAIALGGMDLNEPAIDTGPAMTLWQAGFMLVATLMQGAWYPLWMIAAVMLYVDLRIRREAYDLELLTRAVEARVEAV
jgi:hypothetical protein